MNRLEKIKLNRRFTDEDGELIDVTLWGVDPYGGEVVELLNTYSPTTLVTDLADDLVARAAVWDIVDDVS